MRRYKLYKNKNYLTSSIQKAQGMERKCNYKLFASSTAVKFGVSVIKAYYDLYCNKMVDCFQCLTGGIILCCWGQMIIDETSIIITKEKLYKLQSYLEAKNININLIDMVDSGLIEFETINNDIIAKISSNMCTIIDYFDKEKTVYIDDNGNSVDITCAVKKYLSVKNSKAR